MVLTAHDKQVIILIFYFLNPDVIVWRRRVVRFLIACVPKKRVWNGALVYPSGYGVRPARILLVINLAYLVYYGRVCRYNDLLAKILPLPVLMLAEPTPSACVWLYIWPPLHAIAPAVLAMYFSG